jgi:hypothetical protein
MERKQIFGLVGSLLLLMGVFMPIISLPIIGSMNYFQNGKGDGVIILVLAVISLVITLTKKYKLLLITGFLSLGMMAFTLINFWVRMNDLEKSMGDNPFAKSLGKAVMSTVQIQWGWIVLVIGAVTLIVAALIKNNDNPYAEAAGF